METKETKLNDSCPLGRELDTDELENVSGGLIPGLSNMVSNMAGDTLGQLIDSL
jgi:bacteriocin-like protein